MRDVQERSILDLGRDLTRIHRGLGDQVSSSALDAIDDIERLIATRQAGDEAEAAVQLMLVHNGLEYLAGELDDDLQDQMKRVSKMVASALQILVKHSRIDLAEFASDWYLPVPTTCRPSRASHPRDGSSDDGGRGRHADGPNTN